MLSFELTVLGCSSATPTSTRHPTAQVLNVHERFFLIDCGEAAQIQLRRFGFKIQRIEHIFISHLHGDHYLGLPGLLGTLHLLGRKKEVHLHAPRGLEEIIRIHHLYSQTHLNFPLIFHTFSGRRAEKIWEDEKITVETIPMEHRIPCCGFLFREKSRKRNIIKEKMEEYKIPFFEIPKIKDGADFAAEGGKIIPNAELTLAPLPPRSYAYCSDTLYTENYLEQIADADLLYHEATFTEAFSVRAKETFHCTAKEAGLIAKKANVKKLLIGHYSVRYKDLEPLLKEASEVFENTALAAEGETYRIENYES